MPGIALDGETAAASTRTAGGGRTRVAAEVSSAIRRPIVLCKIDGPLETAMRACCQVPPDLPARFGHAAVPRETFGRLAAGGRFHVKHPERGIVASRANFARPFHVKQFAAAAQPVRFT